MTQSARAVPGGRDLLRQPADPSLDVGGGPGGLGVAGGGEHDVGLVDRRAGQGVDGDHRPSAGERPAGEVGVGEVGQRVGAEEHEHVELAAGRSGEDAGGVEADVGGHRGPRLVEVGAAGVESDPAGQHPGGETGIEGAVHVAATQAGQEADVVEAVEERTGSGDDDVGGVGQVAAAEHDGHRPVAQRRLGRGDGRGVDAPGRRRRLRDQRGGDRGGATGGVRQGVGRQLGDPGAGGDDLDQRGAVLDHGVAQAQVEDGQLFLDVDAHHDDGAAGSAGLVDGGPGQAEDDLRWQAVAQLAVDVVGPDDALGQLGPGVGGFVGEAGAADDTRRRPGRWSRGRLGWPPRCGPGRDAHDVRWWASPSRSERFGETVLGVDGLEVEPALVAEPAPVDVVDVDALVAQHLVAAGLHGHPAARPSRRCRWTPPGRGPTGGP